MQRLCAFNDLPLTKDLFSCLTIYGEFAEYVIQGGMFALGVLEFKAAYMWHEL